jgi:putative ABC transport system permease protein
MLLALGSLRRTPLRVALTSLGVAIATGAIVSMVGFALGIQAQVEEPFQRMELVNGIDVRPKPGEEAAVLDDDALAQIAALPGVVLAYPDLRLEKVQCVRDSQTTMASAVGLPREAGRLLFVSDALVAGRFFSPASGPEVILGRKLARDLGFPSPEEATGQTLTLKVRGLLADSAGKFHLEQQQLEVTVAGVWDPPGGKHGYTTDGCVLPVDVIRDLPGARLAPERGSFWQLPTSQGPGYAGVVVRVGRPSDVFAVEQRIVEMGFRAQTLLSQFKQMQKGFVLMDLILTAVGTVALVVAGLGIINTQLMAVLERFREIGTYKALGASDGDVRLLFLGEASLVGLLGGLGGLVLGRVVSWVIEVVVNSLAQRQGVEGPVMAFAFPPTLLGGALLFALMVSLLSGVYPASRAARVDPVRALRAE